MTTKQEASTSSANNKNKSAVVIEPCLIALSAYLFKFRSQQRNNNANSNSAINSALSMASADDIQPLEIDNASKINQANELILKKIFAKYLLDGDGQLVLSFKKGKTFQVDGKNYQLTRDVYTSFLFDYPNIPFFFVKTDDKYIGKGAFSTAYKSELAFSLLPEKLCGKTESSLHEIKAVIKCCQIEEKDQKNLALQAISTQYTHQLSDYDNFIDPDSHHTKALIGQFMSPQKPQQVLEQRVSLDTEHQRLEENISKNPYHCHNIEPYIPDKTLVSCIRSGFFDEYNGEKLLQLTEKIFDSIHHTLHKQGYVHCDAHGNNIFVKAKKNQLLTLLWDFDQSRTAGCNQLPKFKLDDINATAAQRHYFEEHGYQTYHDIYNPIFYANCITAAIKHLYLSTDKDPESKKTFRSFYTALAVLTKNADMLFQYYCDEFELSQLFKQAGDSAAKKIAQYSGNDEFSDDDIKLLIDNMKIDYQRHIIHQQRYQNCIKLFNQYCKSVFSNQTLHLMIEEAKQYRTPAGIVIKAHDQTSSEPFTLIEKIKYKKIPLCSDDKKIIQSILTKEKKAAKKNPAQDLQQEPHELTLEQKTKQLTLEKIKNNTKIIIPKYRQKLKKKAKKAVTGSSFFNALVGGSIAALGVPFLGPLGMAAGFILGAVMGAAFSLIISFAVISMMERLFKTHATILEAMQYISKFNQIMEICVGKDAATKHGLSYQLVIEQTKSNDLENKTKPIDSQTIIHKPLFHGISTKTQLKPKPKIIQEISPPEIKAF